MIMTKPPLCALAGLWLSLGVLSAATAQTPPAAPGAPSEPRAPAKAGSAQSEAGEPRADTSGPAAGVSGPGSATPAVEPGPAAAPSASRPPAGAARGSGAATPASADKPDRPKAAGDRGAGKNDRLDLGLATVTGDQEQPKVLYIVPWKKSDIGDLQGRPMNSLVDEILSPVDRDVFKREVVYYKALQSDTSQNGTGPAPAPKGEK